MKTLKIKYSCNNVEFFDYLLKIRKQQSNVIHYCYNRYFDGENNTTACQLAKTKLNNINLIDSWFIQSANKIAKSLYDSNKNKKCLFGGKKNLVDYHKGLKSKEEFNEKRLANLVSIGEKNYKGNRKFELDIIDNNQIIFKPNRHNHFILKMPKLRKNYKKELSNLDLLSKYKKTPITFQLDKNCIHIIYEEQQIEEYYPISNLIYICSSTM